MNLGYYLRNLIILSRSKWSNTSKMLRVISDSNQFAKLLAKENDGLWVNIPQYMTLYECIYKIFLNICHFRDEKLVGYYFLKLKKKRVYIDP